MTPATFFSPACEADPDFRAADLGQRDRLAELRTSARALVTVLGDTGRQAELFTVFRCFPVFDLMRYSTERLPILTDPRFIDLYERGALPDLTEGGIGRLASLPEGTFGHSFAAFCRAWGLGDAHLHYLLPPDNPMRYLIYRTALFHDVFHFLTGFRHMDVLGELEVDAFQYAQSGLLNHPLFMAGGLGNVTLKAPRRLREAVARARTGFLIGQRAQPILLTSWEGLWEQPEQRVREQLGLGDRRGYLPADLDA